MSDVNRYDPEKPVENAIGMLTSLIIQFPDLDDYLRPILEELKKTEPRKLIIQ